MKQVTAVIAASFALTAAALTVTPASHDFGDVPVGGGRGNYTGFDVTLPTGAGPTDTLVAEIQGPDASEFMIETLEVYVRSPFIPGMVNTPGTTDLCEDAWRTGSCSYVVDFYPTSVGLKTATLIVADTRGNRATAALKGKGVAATCRPYLVPCNWADLYSGQFTIQQVDSTVLNDPTKMRQTTTIDVTIDQGVATCDVIESGFSEGQYGGKILWRTSSQGVIRGPGLFALEFEESDGTLVYKMSFACPSVNGTSTTEDYVQGTQTTDTYTSEPADWDNAALVADYQPATVIGMQVLNGTQQDLREPMGDDVAGYTNIKWDLRRQ